VQREALFLRDNEESKPALALGFHIPGSGHLQICKLTDVRGLRTTFSANRPGSWRMLGYPEAIASHQTGLAVRFLFEPGLNSDGNL